MCQLSLFQPILFLEGLKEEERKKYEEELETMKKKHKDHKPVSWNVVTWI